MEIRWEIFINKSTNCSTQSRLLCLPFYAIRDALPHYGDRGIAVNSESLLDKSLGYSIVELEERTKLIRDEKKEIDLSGT